MLSVASPPMLANSKVQKKQQQRRRPGSPKSGNTTALTSVGPTQLDRVLQDLQCYDETNDRDRLVALEYLEKILAQWALSLRTINHANSSAPPVNPWQRPRVALVSFGSYRLGVHRKTSDIDVLAVCPPCCSRHDFFTSLISLLKEDPSVEQVHPIPQAYTPVIKFYLKGLQIDMLFARVSDASKLMSFQQQRVSPLVAKAQSLPRVEYSITDVDLMDLDEATVRSMNGARVSQILLQLVPNLENFRTVLKAVKEWATQAGIYSNVLGFLGGINWAILVAWVCMRHPKATNTALLEIFFQTFATWNWPKPVLLAPIQDTPPPGVLPLPAWNPNVNPRDGLHICPIITPAYPSMNSSYNVGMPQLRRIQDEMILACNHLKEKDSDYSSLFKPSDFFTRHEHYLQVTIRASNRQDFLEWFRLVESRLRLLICSVETQQVHAWPFAQFFDCQYSSDGTYLGPGKTQDETAIHESMFFIALRFAPGLDSINLQHLTSDFLHKVNSWEKRNAGMELSMVHVISADLPSFILPRNGTSKELTAKKAEKKNDKSFKKDPKNDDKNAENVAPSGPPAKGIPDNASPTKKYRRTEEPDELC
jgi:poly(A) polymerase